jgi:hypothetical protein
MTSSEKSVAEELWDESLDGWPPPNGPVGSLSRAWRIVLLGSACFWLLVAVETFSNVALNIIILAFLFVIGMIQAIVWAFWTFCLVKGLVRLRSRFEMAQWTFVPLAGLLGFVLMLTDLDLDFRLRLSEPALQRCFAELSPVKEIHYGENARPVGLFRFNSIDGRDGCILMRSDAAFVEGGLIYCTSGRPPQWSPEYVFRHIRGPWWLYENNY